MGSRGDSLAAIGLVLLLATCSESAERDRGTRPSAEARSRVVRERRVPIERAPPVELGSPRPTPEPSESVRPRQIEILGLVPIEEGLDELLRVLAEDADPRLRESAIVALAHSEDGRAIDALIAATADSDRRVALAAIELLSWSDDR